MAHWITANWERCSIVIEFVERVGRKSRQAMAELIWETLRPDRKKVTEEIKDNIITITTEERVGLNWTHKALCCL